MIAVSRRIVGCADPRDNRYILATRVSPLALARVVLAAVSHATPRLGSRALGLTFAGVILFGLTGA
jgi:hypothetical protein